MASASAAMFHIKPPLRIDRWRTKCGESGISILDADGMAIANMIAQIDDSELEQAKAIVAAVNQACVAEAAA